MRGLRVLVQLVRADLLARTRRYSFLITLGVMVYLGYLAVPPLESGALTVDLGGIRGIYNSAWIGSMTALLSSMVLSLPGFYLVKNAIKRDRETGVGQIIATTPLSKPLYTVGKSLSNVIFLGVIMAVVGVAAMGMQLIRGEAMGINVWELVAPFLFTTAPTLMLVAAVAVLFETIPPLRGGFGNVAYFVLWMVVISVSMSGVSFGGQGVIEEPINDPLGASVIAASMHQGAHAAFPDRELDVGIGYTRVETEIRTFRWDGVFWTADVILDRAVWVAVALGIALSSALLFDRFDPARSGLSEGGTRDGVLLRTLARTRRALRRVSPRAAVGSRLWDRLSLEVPPLPPFGRVLVAELRLMLKGLSWWWYVGAVGFIVAGATAGDAESVRGWLSAAWIWPILVWSGLGVRESRHGTGPIVFAVPRPLSRQFVAMWLAGVLITLMTGAGAGFHLLVDGAWGHVCGWTAAMLFIPTLALLLGTWSGTSKLFEAVYVVLWYVGPVSQFGPLDFTSMSGAAVRCGMPLRVLAVTSVSLMGAAVGRWRQVSGRVM